MIKLIFSYLKKLIFFFSNFKNIKKRIIFFKINLLIMNSNAINLKNTKEETVVIVDKDDNIIGKSSRFIMVKN